MRGGGLPLVLAAAALLVSGLASGSHVLLVSSIAASLLAALAMIVDARRPAAAGVDGDRPPERAPHIGMPGGDRGNPRTTGARLRPPQQRLRDEGRLDPEPADGPPPTGGGQPGGAAGPGGADADLGADTDEPPAQEMPASDLARLARLSAEVLVVDGRPRYHLPRCPHLPADDSETLPVAEALELGFAPCGACTPNSSLLGDGDGDGDGDG